MEGHPLILADGARARQFALLGQAPRLFQGYDVWADANHVPWAVKRQGEYAFAVTWLGPGWVFDPFAQKRWAAKLKAAWEAVNQADAPGHREELARAVGRLRLGGHAERILWAVQRAVLAAGASTVRMPDHGLGAAVWGRDRSAWPSHWRQDLGGVLTGLTWLHVADWPGGDRPAWGQDTALLTHAADLRGKAADACDDSCPDWGGRPHHHYLVNVGRGFLGVLEQFAEENDDGGSRSYCFPVSGRRGQDRTLRRVGKTGRLVSIYLPAKLGAPAACAAFTHRQGQLLQTLVRETTRARRRARRDVSEAEVFEGNRIRDVGGRRLLTCRFLDPRGRHVGFNGNGCRRGLGYRLTTPGGWLAKAGYKPSEASSLLDDLGALAAPLGLTVVGLQPSPTRFLSLDQLCALSQTEKGRRLLDKVHLRVFGREDYLHYWNTLLGWADVGASPLDPANQRATVLVGELRRKGISRRALAAGIGRDPSFMNKVLNGMKPWPEGLIERAWDWVAAYGIVAESGLGG